MLRDGDTGELRRFPLLLPALLADVPRFWWKVFFRLLVRFLLTLTHPIVSLRVLLRDHFQSILLARKASETIVLIA